MIINSAALIYFSPTGTTKKIMDSIVKGMNLEVVKTTNLTSPLIRKKPYNPIEEDIVIIGVPVYEERIPKLLYPFLTNLKGNSKPVVIAAVYGNIGYGIALNELYRITKIAGFNVAAAGAFIGEHSFSTKNVPIAEGRPTHQDLSVSEEFGRNIMKLLRAKEDLNYEQFEIPQGKLPVMAKILPKHSARLFTRTPDVDMESCNGCCICVKLCPVSAIDEETLEVDENRCLRCFSCAKRCPQGSRRITYKKKLLVSAFLKFKSRIRKEPELFI